MQVHNVHIRAKLCLVILVNSTPGEAAPEPLTKEDVFKAMMGTADDDLTRCVSRAMKNGDERVNRFWDEIAGSIQQGVAMLDHLTEETRKSTRMELRKPKDEPEVEK